ncbi:hypothetical protein PQ469_14400 [Mucilaginibacter sp. KACC 22773]|uniref:hypothetical protein n=1 Tax=Mucilaginibacter sp. KACC 22773 TaxID=3025671 RepID=UPI002364FF9C|nr:hypothetical protein [Mucilaginibacter sp. KACC 22773]WDF81199.1 hypothetical protein PQ469_14400 [Mucilaginibacter sp. KACC 22773]
MHDRRSVDHSSNGKDWAPIPEAAGKHILMVPGAGLAEPFALPGNILFRPYKNQILKRWKTYPHQMRAWHKGIQLLPAHESIFRHCHCPGTGSKPKIMTTIIQKQ